MNTSLPSQGNQPANFNSCSLAVVISPAYGVIIPIGLTGNDANKLLLEIFLTPVPLQFSSLTLLIKISSSNLDVGTACLFVINVLLTVISKFLTRVVSPGAVYCPS